MFIKPLNFVLQLSLVLYLFPYAIADVSGLRVRVDEVGFLLLIFISLFFIDFRRLYNVFKNPFFSFWLIYILYFFLIGSINFLLGNNQAPFLFYTFRDLQGYSVSIIIAYVVAYSYERDRIVAKIIFIFTIFVLVNLTYGLFQFVTKNFYGLYGVATFGLENASFVNGFYFFLIFCFSLVYFFRSPGLHSLLIVLASSLMLFMTGVRTFLFSGMVFLIFQFLFSRISNFRKITIVAFFVIIGPLLSNYIVEVEYDFSGNVSVLDRYLLVFESIDKRVDTVVEAELSNYLNQGIGQVFGNGRGAYEFLTGSFKRVMHSQFSRSLVEGGLVGLMFLNMLFYYFYYYFSGHNNSSSRGYIQLFPKPFVVAFFVAFLGIDAFNVPRMYFGFSIIFGVLVGYHMRERLIENLVRINNSKIL